MKIALLGYGKMGHEIEKAALQQGHSIELIIDNAADWAEKGKLLTECDVAIDFSVPKITIENMYRCFEANVPVVVGTTGWYAEFEQIRAKCQSLNGTLFYATNFSIGVNIFRDINRRLASLLKDHPVYSPSLTEIHHAQKLDAPSGTAITLANDIISENSHYHAFTLQHAGEGEIPVTSVREGNVTGTHIISWNSDIDQISITHKAMNRQGFALGAITAAEWVYQQKGIFTMSDMLNL